MRRGLALVLAGVSVFAGTPVTEAVAAPEDSTITVRVVRDVNGNGAYDPALEVGVQDVPVTVTGANGNGKGTTGTDGTVKITVPVGGYRVQAEAKAPLRAAPSGNGLSSLTEFVTGANPTVTMGLWNPGDYCQSNPTIALACQRDGRSVVTFPFTARGTTAPTQLAKQSDTGAVYGLAYRRQDKRLFEAAFAKRNAPYGKAGPGGIYVTKNTTTTLFATVPNAGSTQHGDENDQKFAAAAGKESLGDIEVSEDGTALYVVNMANKTLYVYDATVPTASAPVADYAIPDPGCGADWRPAALGAKDGVVYVGGVCSGQSTNKLADVKAVVLPFKGNAFGPAVLSKAMDGERSVGWHAWNDSARGSQPLLTNIGVENNGDLVLAFRDRLGDQNDTATTAGDINRACEQADGTYTWECGKKEFYAGEYNGDNTETAVGSVAVVPGAERMPATVTDPLTNGTAGVGWFDRTNGSMQNDKHTNGLQVTGDAKEGLGDLEALCDLAPVQVGNRVWFDENTNGVEDGDEPPLAGVKVTATPCAGGTALAPKTTNSKGEYAFTTADGLKPDTCYNLKFDYTTANTSVIPGGPPGSSLKWTAKTADSTVDPNTGLATVTVGPAGSVDNSVDAGVVAPTNAIGDYVWLDTNRNGQQDAGEPPVPGVTVLLGNRKTVTGADGTYRFDKLPDGVYQVCFDLKSAPNGYLPAIPNAGADTSDSDADPLTGCTPKVTLGPGRREDLTVDAGLRPPGRIGDLVWSDINQNGMQDDGEPPVPGVTVTAAGLTAVTGLDGKYVFPDLRDGTYTVCVDMKTLPAAFVDFQPTRAKVGDNTKDSDVDPETGCAPPVTLSATSPENLDVDAGLVPPENRIGDLVWQDTNANGLQDTGEPGLPDVAVTLGDRKTVTGRDGRYRFSGMPDGTYTVCFGHYVDYPFVVAKVGDDQKDSDADPATGCAPPVTLGPGNRSVLSIDAGMTAPLNKLGDLVWNDTNRNGMQDTGEPGVAGVPVTVGDRHTTTDTNGRYVVDNLADGKYTVCFDLAKAGDVQATKPDAGDDGKDSDVDPATGCTQPVALGPGSRADMTVDAGVSTPVNRLGDTVFADTNRNGVQDAGEPGVNGVNVTAGALKAVPLNAVTNANGKYLFTDIPDGSYTVCVTPPDGYTAKGCAPTVSVGHGHREVLTVDIPLTSPPNSVGDLVWLDSNRNGGQDQGEPGIAGVRVTAGDHKAVSGADGRYALTDLPDGTYTVCFGRKDDLQFTKTGKGDHGTDSNADPATGCAAPVTLGPGHRTDTSVDAGLAAPVNRVGGLVTRDKTTVVAGVTVAAGGVRAVTGQDGKYLLEGLPDGTYEVCFTPPKGDPGGCVPNVVVGPGHRESLGVDFLFVPQPNSLGDQVWVDTNRNGVQDGGEPGVQGVTVTANSYRAVTGPDGKYAFPDLPDGDYRVCFDLRIPQYAGYLPTLQGKASSALPDGCAETVTLGPGHRARTDVDLGIRPPNSLGDLVWADTNRNGVQDADEPGVAGVKVTVAGRTVVTDAQGKYLVTGLPDGSYPVCFDRSSVPARFAGYQLSRGVVDPGTWCTAPVRLSVARFEDLGVDVGLVSPTNRIGDLVWIDTDGDHVQDPDESGAPGVSLSLRRSTGGTAARAVTDRNGRYVFDQLTDGGYVVCVDTSTLKGYSIGSGVDRRTACTTAAVAVGPSAREVLTVDIGLLAPRALASTGAAVGWLVTAGVVVLCLGVLLLLYLRRRA